MTNVINPIKNDSKASNNIYLSVEKYKILNL